MKKFVIEDVPIHSPDSISEMRGLFSNLISDRSTKYISFINPEIFLQQQKDESLHQYFSQSKYNFIDGIGLLKAVNKKLGTSFNIQDRYPGTDFFEYLPDDREVRVFLYGSKPGNAEIAKDNIESKYKNVSIVGTFDGYTKISDEKLTALINLSALDILIVCIGCPRQEKWVKDHLDDLSVPVVFGNGGSIDFWSNNVKRAPQFMIDMGLEWLFRLFQNFTPERIRRQSKLVDFLVKYVRGQYNIVDGRALSTSHSDTGVMAS